MSRRQHNPPAAGTEPGLAAFRGSDPAAGPGYYAGMTEGSLVVRIGLFCLIALAGTGATWLVAPGLFDGLTGRRPPLQIDMPPRPEPRSATPAPASPAAPAASAPAAGNPATAATPRPELPRFDVARVGNRGTLVTAGRAAAGAEVILLEGAKELGRARADSRGEWVILPPEPLPPGVRELSLVAQSPGGEPVPGVDTVILVVPEAQPDAPRVAGLPQATPPGTVPAATPASNATPAAPAAPLALLLPSTSSTAAPRMLQGAAPAPADQGQPQGQTPGRQRLGVDVVDYDDAGGMRFAGSAPPGTTVRVYVGDGHAGDTVADQTGRWSMTPAEQPALGRHTLRVDQIAAAGTVAGRVEVPFQRDPVSTDVVRDGRLVVQPGANLWRIARNVYGRGIRYTVIYAANREQIRDPARIYPGQVFAVPEGAAGGTPAPADSSRSR